ncbi:MAG: hypothetical protein EPO65_11120 [Dehalococcoidia bacterium]|nr:MAG: hypothetical protein EPO65_11120 [Dehalococcoidia bacterium]
MTELKTHLYRCLDWIARLPLCGDAELARLLDLGEHTVRRLIAELTRLAWIESLEPTSPELQPRRRYLVRVRAVPALASAVGLTKIERELPVGPRETLERVTRFEITVGINRLLADLAAHVRRTGEAELVDARSLPLRLAGRKRWWPAGANGYGCLRDGDTWAPFLIVWDRVLAPDSHRRSRVRAWTDARTALDRLWGKGGLPLVLVVCPGEHERSAWERALLRARSDHPFTVPFVLLTTRAALATPGVGGPIWRRPGDGDAVRLIDVVGWGEPPAFTAPRLSESPDRATSVVCERGESLRAWARADVMHRPDGPLWWQIGALAVVLEPGDRAVVEWLGQHPPLAADELAVFRTESRTLIDRRLEWVIRCGLVRRAPAPGGRAVSEKEVHMHADTEVRYVLTEKGIEFLARRAGVTAAALQASGRVKPKKLWAGDGQSGVRHVEHAIGVNRFLARLAADVRAVGGRLVDARNDVESAHGFADAHGRASAIRPDASGVVEVAGRRFAILLEYDRGTLDGGDFRGKFEGYRRYYEGGAWRGRFAEEPLLLFVCADDAAERRVIRAATEVAQAMPLFTTAEWRIAQGGGGAFGSVWARVTTATSRDSGIPAPRGPLPTAESRVCADGPGRRGEGLAQCQ